MARLYFTVGTRYLHNEQVYIIRQLLLDNIIVAENQSFGGLVTLSQEELTQAWARGEIIFEVHGRYAKKDASTQIATEYTIADFQQLPPGQRDEAWRRYEIIRPLLNLPSEERTRKRLEDYAASLASARHIQIPALNSLKPPPRQGKPMGQAVGRSSIEMWLEAFIDSGYDIRSLVPATDRQGGKGILRLEAEKERIIKSVLEECKSHPAHRTAEAVHLMVVNRIAQENKFLPPDQRLTPPGIATVYRRINAEGKTSILRRRASRLEAHADQPVYPGPKPTRILERVEIDDTPLDLIVVDLEDRLPIGRPTFMYAIDAYSGFPCGLYVGFEPPSYLTVQNCLLHSILPKPDCQQLYETKHSWPVYGLPETLVVDNGKHYICRHLENACGQLGINVEEMPIEAPWYKGTIERFFRTNNTGLIHSLPGTTFSNIIERGDYDSQKSACISLHGFMELLHTFLLDEYAQKWHKGVGASGGIPAKVWEENTQSGFLPCLSHSAKELRFILYPGEWRKIQPTGIEFKSLRYQHPSLAPLRSRVKQGVKRARAENSEENDDGERVLMKYDPADLSTIYVYDPDRADWLPIPALDQEYTQGLSIWKHQLLRDYILRQKKEVNIYELAEAKQHWQRVVEREYALTRRGRTRKKGARFLGIDTIPSSTSTQLSSSMPAEEKETKPMETDKEVQSSTDGLGNTSSPAEPVASATGKERKRRGRKENAQVPSQTQGGSPKQVVPLEKSSKEGWGGDYDLPGRMKR